ncbi:MAG: ribosomal-processing cysteine protease Prp [Candidatus Enteromonas sp.]|nr:ribosomal-processing cysteine protease Prp [Candidatus Enteromonas sp.]
MVKVDIQYRGKGLSSVTIKGHANSGPAGRDLVCAAVSAIAIGSLNALEDSDDYEIEVDDGLVNIAIPGAISEHDQTVLETMIIQLKTIEVSYSEAITIKERK